MSETVVVVLFVFIVYGAFYVMAHKAEKYLKEKAKQNLGAQEKLRNDASARREAQTAPPKRAVSRKAR